MAGRLHYKKVLGTKNPSDVLTKHVPGELLERHLEVTGAEPRGGRAETAPELNSIESVVFRLDVDEGDYEQEDKGKKLKEVRFASKVLYRAIPATGRGRPTKAKRKACWPTVKSSGVRRSVGVKHAGPTVMKAQGELRESYTELDAPLVQAQGELRRTARRRLCSHSEEVIVPGGDGRRTSWADATDRELGP